MIAGGHVDLTDGFTSHDQYVGDVTRHARALEAGRYLLKADADAIVQRAVDSDVGQ